MGPTIIRSRRRHQYLIVCQEAVEDRRISWAARGLLAYLLSKPDDWGINIAFLRKEAPSGRDLIYKILNELIKWGYIIRENKRDKNGLIRGVNYYVYETPVEPLPDNPESVSPEPDYQDTPLPKTELPDQVSQEGLPTSSIKSVSSTTTDKGSSDIDNYLENLVYPSTLLPEEISSANKLVSEFPIKLAQQLLDELAGIVRDGKLRGSPLPCLRGMAKKARAGEFNSARGISVALARRRKKKRQTILENTHIELPKPPKSWDKQPLNKKLREIAENMKARQEVNR